MITTKLFAQNVIAEADLFVSKITECEVKLLYVVAEQITESMRFECAQTHVTQQSVTLFQVSATPTFNFSMFYLWIDFCTELNLDCKKSLQHIMPSC